MILITIFTDESIQIGGGGDEEDGCKGLSSNFYYYYIAYGGEIFKIQAVRVISVVGYRNFNHFFVVGPEFEKRRPFYKRQYLLDIGSFFTCSYAEKSKGRAFNWLVSG